KYTYYTAEIALPVRPLDFFLGKRPWEIRAEDRELPGWIELRELLDRKEPFRGLSVILNSTADKPTKITFAGVPLFDNEGNFIGFRGTTTDNSNEYQLEAGMRSIRDALNQIDVGVSLWDQNNKLVWCNNRVRKITGISQDFFEPGREYREYITAVYDINVVKNENVDKDDWIESRNREFSEGSGDVLSWHADGSVINVSKYDLADGTKVVFTFDVTEASIREAEIKKAWQIAETSSAAKSQFLSSVSHELRTPLNAIMGFTQLLASNPGEPLSKKQGEFTTIVHEASKHLLFLIEKILDLDKIEAGETGCILNKLNPAEIIRKSVAMSEGLYLTHKIPIIDNTLGMDLPLVLADETHLQQIFLNLLSNAVLYNRTGGHVTINAAKFPDDYLRIEVFSTGEGLTAEQQIVMFDPFKRLGREAGEIEGTGIGLTICSELISLMGGKIGVESELGVGTTIWIKLPISPE
ncbi:MAG: PAS-domain containing protein, partial [Rhodospirillales bacterium]|nr:PAS-domain containing protein [Rhodospirillales bacterium]